MKICVCMKQVPVRDAVLRINEQQSWIDAKLLSYEVNEPDAYALEEALKLKDSFGGEVVVCSLGPVRDQMVIKDALAKGADRAIHFEDDAFAALDAFNTAKVLAEEIKKENFDLVLTGLQSDDYGFAQVGVVLAEMLGIAHATIVMDIQLEQGAAAMKVKRELEGGYFQWVELPLPALLTIQSGCNQPRYSTLKGIMAAKKKEIRKVLLSTLGWSAEQIANKQVIQKVYFPVKSKQTEFIEGSPKEAAAKLVEKLRNDARVI